MHIKVLEFIFTDTFMRATPFLRRFIYEWLFHVAFWMTVTLLYTMIYLSNVRTILEYMEIMESVKSRPLLAYMISNYQYLESALFGLLFGTATFGVNLAVEYTTIHKLSYGTTILIKTILYILSMVIVFLFMSGIIINSGMTPLQYSDYQDFVLKTKFPWNFFIGAIAFFVLSTMLINFVFLMKRKFGPGQMWLIFLGKYSKPRTENRIFMFLDLRDSTSIAERLGHIIYSKLLQQCFLDMNKLILSSSAEIYQYVGDEAVLTWRIKNYDTEFIKPIQLFFDFKKRLKRRSKYYETKFGLVPEFKAGINAGVVTVAEIGDLKREIAYHGDVVNTASRLRSACNDFNKQLLASEYVIKNLNVKSNFSIEEIGEVNLKGKQKSIKVYSII
jgi:adenylate cyclase